MILVFQFLTSNRLEIFFLNQASRQMVKKETLHLPMKLSEKLWRLLPRWFAGKTKQIKGVVLVINCDNRPTYSSLRTVLSIMNTMGLVGVPLFSWETDAGEDVSSSTILNGLSHQKKVYNLTAEY